MQVQVDLDGGSSSFVVERMLPQDVLQLQQVHIGTQRHLPHTVGVEVKLVVCDLHKMLMEKVGRDEYTLSGHFIRATSTIQ